jgi:hypothetical protein
MRGPEKHSFFLLPAASPDEDGAWWGPKVVYDELKAGMNAVLRHYC